MITFAIGDIHGCSKELTALMNMIDTYYPDDKHPRRKLVFVGDYIDRGPSSKAVIDIISAYQTSFSDFCEVIALKGNHEAMFLDASNENYDLYVQHQFGYYDPRTTQSFGVDFPSAVPEMYLNWMRKRPIYHDDGLRFFVHAGVNKEPLTETREADMLWIREPFLRNPFPWSRYIVHGHTPLETMMPDIRTNRINLDTACVFGGRLTCAVFNDKEVKPIDILQVEPIK